MSADGKDLLVLSTGLFPDRQTVLEALKLTVETDAMTLVDLDPQTMGEQDWDRVVDLILKSKKVMTI